MTCASVMAGYASRSPRSADDFVVVEIEWRFDIILVNLAGNVGLLIWGTHMTTGGSCVLTARICDGGWAATSTPRTKAFTAGLIVTALLQSTQVGAEP